MPKPEYKEGDHVVLTAVAGDRIKRITGTILWEVPTVNDDSEPVYAVAPPELADPLSTFRQVYSVPLYELSLAE